MADDKAKKPKIDLKARLGRTTQMGMNAPGLTPVPMPPGSSPGGAPPPSDPLAPGSGVAGVAGVPGAPASRPSNVPNLGGAPVSGGAIPAPPMGIAPPPGLSPGIPLPPFGQQPRRAAPEPKQSAAQQTIKVDVGEEVELERRKSRSRIAMGAAAGVVIGLGIGWVGGGTSATGDRAKAAARGAGALEKDVKVATDKLKELDQKLQDAAEKLKNKSFPEDLGTTLSSVVIPFDDTNLSNKGVAGMPSGLFRMVLDFTEGCKSANKARESLRNLAGFTKDPIVKAWKEEASPMANFSVVFHMEGSKPAAELVPNTAPFTWRGDWAEKYKVNKLEGNKPAEKEAKRYVKGDLGGGDLTAIPVDPKTTAAFTSDVMIGRLSKAIYDLRVELEGNKDNPANETPGMVKVGEDLGNELHKAALNQ